MGTVIQEIIKELESKPDEMCTQKAIAGWLQACYIEKEKQQIIDAYWGGLNGTINDYSESKETGNSLDIKYGEGAKRYYNETFTP